MQQLDKWQKELEHLTQKNYKQTDSELFNIYRQSLVDIKKKLYNYTQAYPNLSFSSRLEVERLFHVADEMDAILSASYGSVEETIKNYSAGQAEQGYYGAWYALEQSQNIIMQMPLINHEYVMNLVNAPVAGKRLSKRLYEYRDELAQNVTNNIINGLFEGKSYAEIAKRVSNETEASYKNALRIVITEGGRTQSTTNQKSSENAKALGIDMQKRWLSTLDGKTRNDHRQLDGQTVEIEDDFEIHGHRTKGPRLFGVAKEDIRCRCTTINIVDGVGPELRRDNLNKENIDFQSYNDWAEEKGFKAKTDKPKATPKATVAKAKKPKIETSKPTPKPKQKATPSVDVSKYSQFSKTNAPMQAQTDMLYDFGLETKHKDALGWYTMDGSGDVNEYLRGVNKGSEEARQAVKDIDEAMSKSYLQQDTVMFRGVSKKEADYILKNGEFKDYKSLSLDEEVANGFMEEARAGAVKIKTYVPKGKQGFYIGDKTSFDENEGEYLLRRGAKYRVINSSDSLIEIEIIE